MKILDPGHAYELSLLDAFNKEPQIILTFVKREGIKFPGNIGHYAGTNLQEVLRALVDRIKYLDNQIPHWTNKLNVMLLRAVLNFLEYRAAKRHYRKFKWTWQIEKCNFDSRDGHIKY